VSQRHGNLPFCLSPRMIWPAGRSTRWNVTLLLRLLLKSMRQPADARSS